MSVQILIGNYKHICEQIKRTNADLVDLRERKSALEKEIEQVIQTMDAPGLVVDGMEIFLEKRKRRERMGQKQRREEIARVLEAYKVANVDKVIEELSKIGAVHEKMVVKVKAK